MSENSQNKGPLEIGRDNEHNLKLDIPTLEKRFAHYPEDLREPCLWLGTYFREQCARDTDLLLLRAGKLGIELDKTTWQRILKGQLLHDAYGTERAVPLVKTSKLLRAIKTLQNDARVIEQGGGVPFIVTSVSQGIFDFIDVLRSPDRINKFGFISGHTGTQKTASIDEYCRQNNHLSCVKINSPENGSRGEFITDLAEKFGCPRGANLQRKTNALRESLNERRTIMIENIQWLYRTDKGDQQLAFNAIQKLQEETKCTVIFTLTPVFKRDILDKLTNGFFEQFIGRAGGIDRIKSLPRFAPEEDVLAIAEAYKLEDAEKHLEYLLKISQQPGLIRVLFETLQRAKVRAEAAKTKLTLKHIKAVRGED